MARQLVFLLLLLGSGAPIGCGSSSCVSAGTLISTPDGDRVVEDLQIGDVLFSVNPRTGEQVRSALTAIRTARRTCLRVTMRSGRTITATGDHPFYCVRAQRYLQLAQLLRQDEPCLARCRGGGTLALDAVADVTAETLPRTVYDLTVDSVFHNFIADGVLVHNKSPPGNPTPVDAVLSARELGTGSQALFGPYPGTGPSGAPATAAVTRDPFVAGVGVIHVTRSTPFDQLVILTGDTHGWLIITLLVPVTTLDVELTFAAGVDQLDVFLEVLDQMRYDEPELNITIPADG